MTQPGAVVKRHGARLDEVCERFPTDLLSVGGATDGDVSWPRMFYLRGYTPILENLLIDPLPWHPNIRAAIALSRWNELYALVGVGH